MDPITRTADTMSDASATDAVAPMTDEQKEEAAQAVFELVLAQTGMSLLKPSMEGAKLDFDLDSDDADSLFED